VGPRISIGLPVFNGERALPRALNSFLAQDLGDLEIVISDNASTDGTPEICRQYSARDDRIRYYRNERNLGALKNFNRTLQLARGEYFKWAGHDDWCAPEFLGQCVSVLDRDPSTVLCFAAMAVADRDGGVFRIQRESIDGAASDDPGRRLHAVLWALRDCTGPVFGVIRMSALRRNGGLRNSPEVDRVFLGEMSLLGKIRQIPEPLFFHYGPPGHPGRNEWTWLDPSNAHRPRMATIRIAHHYLAATWRSEMPTMSKLYLSGDIVVGLGVKRASSKLRKLRRRRVSRPGPRSAGSHLGGSG
jgi:glycosyltransferase involved in cell wall biosynthesis